MITLTILKPAEGAPPTETVTGFPERIKEGEMLWVDVESPTEKELADLGRRFSLDSYALEDVAHRHQRPKLEDCGGNVFGVVHVPARVSHRVDVSELFVFFSKEWLITVHSGDPGLIHAVESRVRTRGLAPLSANPTPDLLFYIFLDFAVDAYYPLLDEIEDQLEALDKQAISAFKTRAKRVENVVTISSAVGGVRKSLMTLRRSLTPTRDMLGTVMRGAVPYVADSSLRNFRDIYDHSFQLLETIDNDRDRTGDVRDLYISLQTASTDNIIKLLTIVATIFLPLTLLAGIYGTNFTAGFFEPGSGSALGFYSLIVAMLAIAALLLLSFRRSGWL